MGDSREYDGPQPGVGWYLEVDLMLNGFAWAIGRLDASAAKFGEYVSRLSRLAEIVTVDLHVEGVGE